MIDFERFDFERSDGPGGWRLLLGDGEDREVWEIDLTICASALCGCHEITIALPHAGEVADKRLVRGWARLDPLARRLAERQAGIESASPPEFGALLAAGLSDAAWDRLRAEFLGTKQEQVEAFDPKGEVWDFEEIEEIEEQGRLVPFFLVFRWRARPRCSSRVGSWWCTTSTAWRGGAGAPTSTSSCSVPRI